ncbi:MAG: hypothetical protein AB8F78_14825 [Saprospiraceae bacterium]
MPSDTLMPSGISYVGYRIYIRNVSVVKQKGKEFLLRMEVVNTGKRPISFGPGFPARYLQTRFDESLKASGLLPLGPQIREGLLNTRESMDVGAWNKDVELLVRSDVEIKYEKLSRDNFERVSSTIQRRPSTSSRAAQAQKDASAKTPSDCIDLTLSEVKVLQQNKKTAMVQLTITNSGSTDFPLDNVDEGLSLTMFVSGSPRLSSSSKRIEQINLADRLKAQGQAALAKGENIVLLERVDVSKATRYTAVLIAQLDSGQVLSECSETNNETHALLFD